MMRTVKPVASARKMARYWCSPRFLNASSGPYELEDRPSAPRPTQARKAASESVWKSCGSWMSFGPPSRTRLNRCHLDRRPPSGGGSELGCGAGTVLVQRLDAIGDERHRNDEHLPHSVPRQVGNVIDGCRLQPLHRTDLALVAERPLLPRRQPPDDAGDGCVDLALVGIPAADQADRHAVGAEEDVHARRVGKAPQRDLHRAGQRVEVAGVLGISIDGRYGHRSGDCLAQIEEGGLRRRGAPLRIQRYADEPGAPIGARPRHRVADVRRPRGEGDVAAEPRTELLLELPGLRFRQWKDRRAAADLGVELSRVWRAAAGDCAREPAAQRSLEQRDADEERIAEEVL